MAVGRRPHGRDDGTLPGPLLHREKLDAPAVDDRLAVAMAEDVVVAPMLVCPGCLAGPWADFWTDHRGRHFRTRAALEFRPLVSHCGLGWNGLLRGNGCELGTTVVLPAT